MPQTFAACPTAVVETPVEVVWRLLTNFAGWGDFYDLRVLSVEPPGPAVVGQRLIGGAGPRWLPFRITFEFSKLDEAQHQLEFHGRMPFGLRVHEVLDCQVLGPERCRVNYHCNFTLPPSWRGTLFRLFLGRELTAGPADSIARLKRAAEAAYRR